jgi:hypothetical protein
MIESGIFATELTSHKTPDEIKGKKPRVNVNEIFMSTINQYGAPWKVNPLFPLY